MKKTARAVILAVALALAGSATFTSTASAQPAGTAPTSGGAGLGIGAAAFLGGVAGAQVVYDMALWHIEGILGFDSRDTGGGNNSPTRTQTEVGVRGWYHLRQGTSADFSIGGGIGFNHVSVSNGGGSGTETLLEPGAQARVFLTPNFALFGVVGFALNFGDAVARQSGVALAGHTTGAFGFTYYFR
jgi:hypothetical protein